MAILGITYKTGAGKLLSQHKPRQFMARALNDDIQAVRLPTAYKGQRHLPGYQWMSRMNALVAYESRLEMTILLQLDFNKAVAHVTSQPFVLHYEHETKFYRHTPDFFVRYGDGNGEVVNVKPRQFVQKEQNVRAFEACRGAAAELLIFTFLSRSSTYEPPDLIEAKAKSGNFDCSKRTSSATVGARSLMAVI